MDGLACPDFRVALMIPVDNCLISLRSLDWILRVTASKYGLQKSVLHAE